MPSTPKLKDRTSRPSALHAASKAAGTNPLAVALLPTTSVS